MTWKPTPWPLALENDLFHIHATRSLISPPPGTGLPVGQCKRPVCVHVGRVCALTRVQSEACVMSVGCLTLCGQSKLAELPSMNPVLWSGNFCYLASLQKCQRRRDSPWYWSYRDLHLFCKFGMTFTCNKHVEKNPIMAEIFRLASEVS